MSEREKWHTRARCALKQYFMKRSLTRLTLSFFVTLTGLIGFLISVTLLHLGVEEMWIRYPLAVLGAYGGFLACIRIWVAVEQARFDPHAIEIQSELKDGDLPDEPRAYEFVNTSSRRNWRDYLDLNPFELLDFDGGCLMVILIGVSIGLAVLLASCLANIPTLLADGFLDAFLVVGLYRRLRIAAKEHWLGTTIRKTWTTALTVAAILALAGWALQTVSPESRSIGPALHRILFPE